jgi:hypothetical protein
MAVRLVCCLMVEAEWSDRRVPSPDDASNRPTWHDSPRPNRPVVEHFFPYPVHINERLHCLDTPSTPDIPIFPVPPPNLIPLLTLLEYGQCCKSG